MSETGFFPPWVQSINKKVLKSCCISISLAEYFVQWIFTSEVVAAAGACDGTALLELSAGLLSLGAPPVVAPPPAAGFAVLL